MKILKLEGEGIINCLEQMVEKSREALNKNLLPLNQSIVFFIWSNLTVLLKGNG